MAMAPWLTLAEVPLRVPEIEGWGGGGGGGLETLGLIIEWRIKTVFFKLQKINFQYSLFV